MPGGTQHFGDGSFDAFMRIGYDELDATQTSASQLAQELGPDRLGLGGSDFQPEQFTPTIGAAQTFNVWPYDCPVERAQGTALRSFMEDAVRYAHGDVLPPSRSY